MKTATARRGMALPLVMAVSAVLGALVFTVFQYQSQRVWVTGATVNDISALAAAEAGVACVLAEIQQSPTFATHELTGFDSEGNPRWGRELRRLQVVQSKETLIVDKGSAGTYKGAVGKHPYQAFFKVRAAYLPKTAAGPQAIDSRAQRHLFIEAIGFRQDPTRRQDRATRVRLLVERSNFTEFLVYDGEWVTLGMGSGDDPSEYNIFADGRIYGHQWVHLGNISGGTRQKFLNLSTIRSAGSILTWDPFKVVFQGEPGATGPEGQPFSVMLDPQVDSDGPSEVETANGRILDGVHGGEIPPPRLDLAFYKGEASRGGIVLDGQKTPRRAAWDSYSEFDQMDFVEVDFGKARYGASATSDDASPEGLGVAYPGNFNGIVYSSKPVVVWGSPDRDVTLVSEGDIFLAGDFNTRAVQRQDYRPGYRPATGGGSGSEVPDARYYDYVEPEKFVDSQGNRLPPEDADRMACALIANGRIWRDYRKPGRVLRNELKGLLALEMGLILATLDPQLQALQGQAREDRLKQLASEFVALEPTPGMEIQLPNYQGISAGTDLDGDGIPDLNPSAGILAALFPLSKPDSQDSTQPAFKVMASDLQGDPSLAQVVRQPLPRPHYFSKAQGAIMPRRPHYWQDWTVTKDAKIKIHEAVNRSLATSGGKISPGLFWGPNGDDGLLDEIYDALLEDEAHYQEHLGMGFFGGIQPRQTSRLALANAPQRLYELLRDEQGPDGKPGPFSDEGGKNLDMQKDRLYLPQMTVNAMLFSNAPKNDVNVPGGQLSAGDRQKESDPTRVDRRFHELGNPSTRGTHFLTTMKRMSGSGFNIKVPMIQRLRGSQVRFARGPVVPPQTAGGYYWPPIRRRIYDPDLLLHPPPGIPSQALVKSWENLGATKQEFRRY